jgi:hypothetical protein
MADSDWLAAAFEEHRDHLRAVAYRLLGSMTDADDAVQDTWLRLTGADTSEVENLGGWLTTVVARVSRGPDTATLVDVRAGEIATAVEARLRREHRRRRTVYRREWSIGVGQTRVDIAAINGQLTGCEVKSARDNFGRLEAQVCAYSTVLDTAVLVVEARSAERAVNYVPSWWGVWRAVCTANGRAALEVVQPPGINPAPVPLAVAQLLWRDEALAVLVRRGDARGLRSANRWRLWDALAEQLPLELLQREVRVAIRARSGW